MNNMGIHQVTGIKFKPVFVLESGTYVFDIEIYSDPSYTGVQIRETITLFMDQPVAIEFPEETE